MPCAAAQKNVYFLFYGGMKSFSMRTGKISIPFLPCAHETTVPLLAASLLGSLLPVRMSLVHALIKATEQARSIKIGTISP